jgi:ProP effector
MEQLIAKLEARIDWLAEQLESANEEIKLLKERNLDPVEYSASMDLLQHMADSSAEDTLDLLPIAHPETAVEVKTAEYQLHFDLSYEHADTSSTTITTTEQIDYMTTQQPELHDLQENDTLGENNTSAPEASESTAETATLTPEQKKRQKNQKNNRRLIKMLEDRYPKAFDWNQPKPLKVGIDKDMVLDDDFNASKQKRALAAYTRSDRYKKCLLTGQPRIDLEGVAVNNEPALPESMIPAKTKSSPTRTRTTSRPVREKSTQPAKNKQKPQEKTKASKKISSAPRQDEIYDNLSPEERMKAKLEKLLNKS